MRAMDLPLIILGPGVRLSVDFQLNDVITIFYVFRNR